MRESQNNIRLTYCAPGASCPVVTKIRIEKFGNVIRYTDPPGSSQVIRFHLFCAFVASAMSIVPYFEAVTRLGLTAQFLLPSLLAVLFTFVAFKYIDAARRFAERPTIVEVGNTALSITHPVEGYHTWSLNQISKISCDSAFGWKARRMNFVVVSAAGRRYLLLHGRPFHEVNWLAAQLRSRLAAARRGETI